MGNDVEMRERGFGQKQKSKSVEKRIGAQHTVLGTTECAAWRLFLLRPGRGVVVLMQMQIRTLIRSP